MDEFPTVEQLTTSDRFRSLPTLEEKKKVLGEFFRQADEIDPSFSQHRRSVEHVVSLEHRAQNETPLLSGFLNEEVDLFKTTFTSIQRGEDPAVTFNNQKTQLQDIQARRTAAVQEQQKRARLAQEYLELEKFSPDGGFRDNAAAVFNSAAATLGDAISFLAPGEDGKDEPTVDTIFKRLAEIRQETGLTGEELLKLGQETKPTGQDNLVSVDETQTVNANVNQLILKPEEVRTAIENSSAPQEEINRASANLNSQRQGAINSIIEEIGTASVGSNFLTNALSGDSDGVQLVLPSDSSLTVNELVVLEAKKNEAERILSSDAEDRSANITRRSEIRRALGTEGGNTLQEFGEIIDSEEITDESINRAREDVLKSILNSREAQGILGRGLSDALINASKFAKFTVGNTLDGFGITEELSDSEDLQTTSEATAQLDSIQEPGTLGRLAQTGTTEIPFLLTTLGVGAGTGLTVRGLGGSTKVAGRAASTAASVFGGLRSSEGAVTQIASEGGTFEEQVTGGILNFLTTTLVTAGFNRLGAGGVEDFTSSVAGSKAQLAQILFKAGVGEGAEEIADEIINGTINAALGNSERAVTDIARDSLEAGLFGAIFGTGAKSLSTSIDKNLNKQFASQDDYAAAIELVNGGQATAEEAGIILGAKNNLSEVETEALIRQIKSPSLLDLDLDPDAKSIADGFSEVTTEEGKKLKASLQEALGENFTVEDSPQNALQSSLSSTDSQQSVELNPSEPQGFVQSSQTQTAGGEAVTQGIANPLSEGSNPSPPSNNLVTNEDGKTRVFQTAKQAQNFITENLDPETHTLVEEEGLFGIRDNSSLEPEPSPLESVAEEIDTLTGGTVPPLESASDRSREPGQVAENTLSPQPVGGESVSFTDSDGLEINATDNKITATTDTLGITSPSLGEIPNIQRREDNAGNRIGDGIAPDARGSTGFQKFLHRAEGLLFRFGNIPRTPRKVLNDLEFEKKSFQTQFTALADSLDQTIKRGRSENEANGLSEQAFLALRGDQNALAQLPADVRREVERGRDSIDDLSQRLIDEGVVGDGLADAVGNNIGSYLSREFRVFDPDQNWNYDTVRTQHNQIYQNAINYIQGNNGVTVAEADLIIREMLDANRASSFYNGQTKVGAVDVTSFIKRKDLHPAILDLLGEVRDPIQNIANTGSKVGGIFATHQAQERIAQILIQQGWASRQPDPARRHFASSRIGSELVPYAGLDDDGNPAVFSTTRTAKKFSGFGELYVVPELKDSFEAHFGANGEASFYDTIAGSLAKLTSFQKFNQVVLNPAAYPTNTVGAFFVEVFNGRLTPNAARNYWKSGTLNRRRNQSYSTQDQSEFYALSGQEFQDAGGSRTLHAGQMAIEMERHGIRDNSVGAKDLTEAVEMGYGERFSNRAARASTLYQAPDNASKRAAFSVEIDKWSRAEPNLPMNEIVRLAAVDVKRTTQNYDMVPQVLKKLSQTGLGVGTYISFTYEMVRNVVGTFETGYREMRSGNPVLQRAAAKRAAGMMTTGAMLYALNESVGGDDEERRLIEDHLVPPWLTGKGILYFGKKDGKFRYADPSYIIPHQMFYNAGKGILRAARSEEEDLLKETQDILVDNFGQLNIMMQTAAEVVANQKREGGEIFNSEIDGDAAPKILDHIWDSMYKPGIWKTIEKMIDAKQGKTKSFGSTATWEDIAWNVVGVRPYTVDVKDPSFLEGHMTSFAFRNRELNSFASTRKQAKRSDREQLEAIESVEKSSEEIAKEIRGFYEAAKKMGVTVAEIRKAESETSFPKEFRHSVLFGN